MKKIKLTVAIALLSSITLFQSGCIGSFELTNRVLDFNRSLDDKIIQEVVFLAFIIVPVYEVTTLIDAVILNLVEFWTDENPLSSLDNKNDKVDVKKDGNNYTFFNKKTREKLVLKFNPEDKSVSMLKDGKEVKLASYDQVTNRALVYLPDGDIQYFNMDNKSTVELKKALSYNYSMAMK